MSAITACCCATAFETRCVDVGELGRARGDLLVEERDLLVDVGRDEVDDGVRERVRRLLAPSPAAAASTVISTSGETFLPWPALTTAAEVTWPRSWPSVRPLAARPPRSAASERMIWLTVFGFVARLWIWPPPEVVKGWPEVEQRAGAEDLAAADRGEHAEDGADQKPGDRQVPAGRDPRPRGTQIDLALGVGIGLRVSLIAPRP